MIRIAIMVANRTEDIELVVPADLWRRAGLYVKLISVEKKKNVILSNGIKVSCDDILINENLSKYNAIFLPGGDGYKQFNKIVAPKLIAFMKKNADNPKVTFMSICAATEVYGEAGMLEKVSATCYPGNGYETTFKKTYSKKPVVVDKNFITASGPGVAYDFALEVIKQLVSPAKAKEVAEQTLYHR